MVIRDEAAAADALASFAPANPDASAEPTEHPTDVGGLTGREQEVLLLVGQGLSNQEIAEEFFISPHTAKTHVNRIMSNINAHDRAQLVILAYESGLVTAAG